MDSTPTDTLRSWEARARHAEASAETQALRAQAWQWQARVAQGQVAIIQRSLFWRLTLPLRLAVVGLRGFPESSAEGRLVRNAVRLARREGLHAATEALRAWHRRRAVAQVVPASGDRGAADPDRPGRAEMLPLAPLVIIVAELSVPQCAKYRVWQKQEHFLRLGVPCRVIDWHDRDACFSAAALATQAILYRVPGVPDVLALIDALRGYGVPLAWEVDDLIFDETLYRQNSNLADLTPELRKSVLEGVTLYRGALLASGRGIASTPELARAMRAAGVDDVAVVENALDRQTLELADAIVAARTPHAGVRITYGSGTKTHDTDFLQAAPALLRLMLARPGIILRIIGELRLPADFDAVAERTEMLGPVPYAQYMRLLGDSDICIAPLEPSVFNDAKSNIKFLEAAILALPSVCSPRAQFACVIRDGANGYLADDDAAWFQALDALAGDAARRHGVGEAARADALSRYAPASIARDQVAPLVVPPAPPRAAGRLRVLMANVFYAPRSYGGATIVVEEMARRLHARADTEIVIATTLGDVARQAMTRVMQDGITVFALPTSHGDIIAEYDDPDVARLFGQVLDAVLPDIVHLHSVQRLSGSLATACRARGIPLVITLHDPWWLCARQFMVREDGTYCFQRRIDLHVCEACLPGSRHLGQRASLLRDALDGADLLISPSAAHRALYLAQGIAPARIVVAPNGVRLPVSRGVRRQARPAACARQARASGSVMSAAMRRSRDIRWCASAFADLARAPTGTLVLVDNTLNLGFASIDVADMAVTSRPGAHRARLYAGDDGGIFRRHRCVAVPFAMEGKFRTDGA